MLSAEERANISTLAKEGDLEALNAQAAELETKLADIRERADAVRQALLQRRPLGDRLTYAATTRCECGAGMAYDPASDGDGGPFKGPSKWECSAILRRAELTPDELAAAQAATHTAPLPFAFWEVKSENQPSANGATTRPKPAE